MLQGLFGPSIAFNEHGIAPRLSALGRREGAAVERTNNARVAKRERRRVRALTAAGHYAKASSPTPPRERTVLRALVRALRRARNNGDMLAFQRLARRYEGLMLNRSKRLQAQGVGS